VKRLGASHGATAASVILAGLSWPVWATSLHLGPESILVFLVAAFFAGGSQQKALVCLALPWVHALGPEISAALVLGTGIEAFLDGRPLGSVSLEALGALVGIASVIVLWNHLYEGNWLLGGYAPYRVETYLQNPLKGLHRYLGALVLGAPFLLGLGLWGWTASGKVPGAAVALTLTVVLVLANSPFARTDEARRVVVAAPAWGMVVGQTWDRLRLRPLWAEATLLLGAVPGVYFLMQAGNYYTTPWGIYFLPTSLWLGLLNAGRIWTALLPTSVLILIFAKALLEVRGLFMDTLISRAPRP